MLCFNDGAVFGQFYQGHRMTFGKNRVQYRYFYWQYYRFERFDVYFSEEGGELALYAETIITPELDRIEGMFDYILERRIIFIVYNKLTDFRQSNIGLITGIDEYNVGGVTRIVDNKVFIYFDGNRESFHRQIRSSIAEVIVNEMLYGNALRANMATSATISIPEWFHRGLASYIGEPWSVEMDDRLKDGIRSGRFNNFTRLTGDEAMWAGHSFWRFIEKEYGIAVIPMIVYITRINRNVRNGFLFVLGSNMRALSRDWLDFYTELYANEDWRPAPETPPELRRARRNRVYDRMTISPNGRYMAYSTNDMGRVRIWLRDLETGRQRRIFRFGQRLEQIQDYTYPVMTWHPSGEMLLFIHEARGRIVMTFHDLQTNRQTRRNLLHFEKILDVDFSPDGGRLLFSAMRFGRTDIYIHTLASATNEQITDDIADDLNPRFIDNGNRIIFSSNRMDDTLRFEGATIRPLAPEMTLFIYDLNRRSNRLISLADAPHANQTSPVELSRNNFAFLSDQSGIINRYVMAFDSVISHIDTAVHYRYMVTTRPLTDFSRNIRYHDLSVPTGTGISMFQNNGRFPMFRTPVDENVTGPLQTTYFRREYQRRRQIADSIAFEAQNAIPAILLDDGNVLTPEGDTIFFDMNHVNIYRYVFEVEKVNFFQNEFMLTDFRIDDEFDRTRNQIRIYQTAFYPNYLVTQADFGFLEASYQAFTGGAVMFNPGFNVFMKLGASDLFEDYKIIGGVRLGANLRSNEFLLSFENLKYRLDRQIVLHRQAFENSVWVENEFLPYGIRTVTHQVFYSLRWPFSQTFAVRGTASFRDDNTSFLTDNRMNANPRTWAGYRRNWAGLKGEIIFDNTRRIGINILDGLRYKVFAESYWQLNEFPNTLYVIGADFRYYQPIHRNLIWASRFAASSSFGRSRLLYYLGSLDNWITFFRREPIFDTSVRVDHQERYAYQALATNMRGFVQNIRNGNNFALMNNEIRWPFVQYFARHPMSNFWSSLQVVGFFDVGSAWSGISPWGRTSAYDYEIIERGNVTVTIETGRDPFVYGYGFGLRTQLFGYFMRFDWAWGIENRVVLPRIFYFSMSLDF